MLVGVIAEGLLLPFVDLGNIMAEAASAVDVADAVPVYNVAIAEAATAASMQDATAVGAITGAIAEAATAVSVQDATIAGVTAARDAMLFPGVFVNSDTSREAYVPGIMVNI